VYPDQQATTAGHGAFVKLPDVKLKKLHEARNVENTRPMRGLGVNGSDAPEKSL